MKISELIKYLKKNGCYLKRNGSNHDIWCNKENGQCTAVPRHSSNEVPKGTLKQILKDLGL